MTLCRLTSSQLLTLRAAGVLQAARALGVSEGGSPSAICWPNALAPLIVAITLAIPTAIFAEAGLSFLGIGINEATPSLGKIVADSAQYIRVYCTRILPDAGHRPGDARFTFVGDGLRDARTPRQN